MTNANESESPNDCDVGDQPLVTGHDVETGTCQECDGAGDSMTGMPCCSCGGVGVVEIDALPKHGPSDDIEQSARHLLEQIDSHDGPYPQCPELHSAIEQLRDVLSPTRCDADETFFLYEESSGKRLYVAEMGANPEDINRGWHIVWTSLKTRDRLAMRFTASEAQYWIREFGKTLQSLEAEKLSR